MRVSVRTLSEDEAAMAKLNRLDVNGAPLGSIVLEYGPSSVRHTYFMDFLDLPLDTVVVMMLSRGQSLVSRILWAGACFLFRLGRIVWLLNAVYIRRCVDSSATISLQSLAEALDWIQLIGALRRVEPRAGYHLSVVPLPYQCGPCTWSFSMSRIRDAHC
jgi:hypothetical protein